MDFLREYETQEKEKLLKYLDKTCNNIGIIDRVFWCSMFESFMKKWTNFADLLIWLDDIRDRPGDKIRFVDELTQVANAYWDYHEGMAEELMKDDG